MGTQLEFWLAGGIPVNREQVYLWMDNYCRNSPLSNIVFGAGELMNDRTKGALAERVRMIKAMSGFSAP